MTHAKYPLVPGECVTNGNFIYELNVFIKETLLNSLQQNIFRRTFNRQEDKLLKEYIYNDPYLCIGCVCKISLLYAKHTTFLFNSFFYRLNEFRCILHCCCSFVIWTVFSGNPRFWVEQKACVYLFIDG